MLCPVTVLDPKAMLAIAGAVLVAGCSTERPGEVAPSPIPVDKVVPRIKELSGKTVSAAGYLGECEGYECRLFVDEAGWYRFVKAVERLRRDKEYEEWPAHLGVGIGEMTSQGPAFDAKAKRYLHSYVVITGKMTDKCRDEHNQPGCLDRSTDIEPTEIRAWTQSEGAPTNTH